MKKIISVLLLSFTWLIAVPSSALVDGGVESLRQTGKAFAEVSRAVSPSVVFIQVEASTPAVTSQQFPTPFGDDFFRRFFGDQFPGIPNTPPGAPQGEHRAIGQGSGFVFKSRDGLLKDKTYILTNNHVVEHAEKIKVKFQDGREFDAKVTGRDPLTDVAVIEINEGGFPAIPLADSSKLEVGEWVIAIGNPFGLSHTLTVGVVSAKGRTGIGLNDYEDFIQTDAAINPGNSGGPLVNIDGKVVGMNTAIFSRSGGSMGIGFAIPVNLARVIANQLIEHGEVTRGFLGIMIQEITPDLAESFDIEIGKGILISQVSEDSPAKKAGLRQGDVIIAYDGKPVKNVGDFRNKVSLTPPGTRKEITILRDGKEKKLTVEIGKLDKDKLTAQGDALNAEEIGLAVQTITPEIADQFGVETGQGVVVTDVKPGSIAALAGITPGTVILQVNRKEISSATEFRKAIKASMAKKRALLLIRKDGAQRFVALNW